jgi:nucleotide-binding universal stress UspA family protein
MHTFAHAPPLVESVLHPTDFSPASERAFAHALAIALLRQTEFTVLHVAHTKSASFAWEEFPAVRRTLERWNLLRPGSGQAAVFDELGVRVKKIVRSSRFPAVAVVDYLADHPSDLIVLATEGREGPARWLGGSVAEAVARWSRTMTLFVPAMAEREIVSFADGKLTLRNVLVPVDRQPDPARAIEFARRAAEVLGDDVVAITLLHVGDQKGEPDLLLEDGRTWAFKRLHRDGDPVDEILDVAQGIRAELIVMPTAGHHGIFDALRGSTTERVLRRASCPLLAVPSPPPYG